MTKKYIYRIKATIIDGKDLDIFGWSAVGLSFKKLLTGFAEHICASKKVKIVQFKVERYNEGTLTDHVLSIDWDRFELYRVNTFIDAGDTTGLIDYIRGGIKNYSDKRGPDYVFAWK